MIKNFTASGAIAAYSQVKFGAADGVVAQAAAETDTIIGVAGILGAADGERIDIVLNGPAEIKLAGTVTRGGLITSDASGLGVALTSAMITTGGATSVAQALVSGVSGDIIPVKVSTQLHP